MYLNNVRKYFIDDIAGTKCFMESVRTFLKRKVYKKLSFTIFFSQYSDNSTSVKRHQIKRQKSVVAAI